MELLLIAGLLTGSAGAGVGLWLLTAMISMVLVIPKVNRVGQPVLPWGLACVALPLVTYGIVSYKVD